MKLAENECAIIVTHRMGSARLADRIIVMGGGGIVDEGTHEELLARPGKYADSMQFRHSGMSEESK